MSVKSTSPASNSFTPPYRRPRPPRPRPALRATHFFTSPEILLRLSSYSTLIMYCSHKSRPSRRCETDRAGAAGLFSLS
ncbi:hypothetical protein EVAR_54324_1 [Eumeta japonica]|uniref:Uncharacterized protein n=1 Tax=Eumeta variegata TaxID=151549 RepID=A0A4C1Y3M1_EUMVA|nr:hypothetical protein EVAR_54324_1 [Eumeta japonica]